MSKDSGSTSHESMGKKEMPKDAMNKGMEHDAMAAAPHGRFSGAEGHEAGGAVEISTVNGKFQVKLGQDFTMGKAPDVYLLLSRVAKGGERGSVNLGKLRKFTGAQSYDVPAGTTPSDYAYVVLWCKQYDVTLGSAPLEASGHAMEMAK